MGHIYTGTAPEGAFGQSAVDAVGESRGLTFAEAVPDFGPCSEVAGRIEAMGYEVKFITPSPKVAGAAICVLYKAGDLPFTVWTVWVGEDGEIEGTEHLQTTGERSALETVEVILLAAKAAEGTNRANEANADAVPEEKRILNEWPVTHQSLIINDQFSDSDALFAACGHERDPDAVEDLPVMDGALPADGFKGCFAQGTEWAVGRMAGGMNARVVMKDIFFPCPYAPYTPQRAWWLRGAVDALLRAEAEEGGDRSNGANGANGPVSAGEGW